MKKSSLFILTVLLLFATGFGINSNSSGVVNALSGQEKTGDNCTTVIVGKGLTEKGNIIQAHNEDLWFDTAQNLIVEPGKYVDPNAIEQFFYTSQPYGVSKTLSIMGSYNFNPEDMLGGLGLGINEKGVLITTNTAHARPEEIVNNKAPFSYSDFIRFALERATTASEAVSLISNAVEVHGIIGDPGIMFFITDANEAWILECTPLHWAAIKCPDNGYIARGNQYGITNSGDRHSSDLITYAIEKGWYTPSDISHPEDGFNFRAAYGDPLWNEGAYVNYNRLREEFITNYMTNKLSQNGKVSVKDMMNIMRSHFEGTDYAANPPHTHQKWVDYTGDWVRRTICNARTVVSFVSEQDSSLPGDLANKLWVTFPSPCVSSYMPIYLSHIRSNFPLSYRNNRINALPNPNENAWWASTELVSTIDHDYANRAPIAKQIFGALENNILNEVINIESQAANLYNAGFNEAAKSLLNTYTDEKAIQKFDLTRDLLARFE